MDIPVNKKDDETVYTEALGSISLSAQNGYGEPSKSGLEFAEWMGKRIGRDPEEVKAECQIAWECGLAIRERRVAEASGAPDIHGE